MADIFHDLPIDAPRERVFEAISTPRGLDEWWTKECEGKPATGETYRLGFGPDYDWADLRILRRYLEHGERVPYEERLVV